MKPQEDLQFTIEVWDRTDQHIEEVLGRVCNVSLAHAVFEGALAIRRGRIRIRHGARIVRDSGERSES
jgi:hypothetical protein